MTSPARFSVRQVVLVNLVFIVLMLAGLLVAARIPVDVFPDISFNAAILNTVWPGASPDEVERLVTRKIEDEITDISGIKQWASFSSEGLSQIDIEWDETLSEFEQQSALNDLRAAIDRVSDLPEDAEDPFLMELSVSEVSDSCMIAVTDDGGVGEYTLREVARALERKAQRLPGVRRARLLGARDRELHVYVDKDRAMQFDVTLEEVSNLIASNNLNVPGGSFSSRGGAEFTLRGLGNFVTPEALAETVIRKRPDGDHLRLEEIATIEQSFEDRRLFGYFNGARSIMVRVGKKKDADVSDVVADVEALVAGEQEFLPPGVGAQVVWDSSIFVKRRMTTLRENLELGVAFVLFLLWLTVGFRNSLLAIVGVPFSFLTALLLFPVAGITINLLSLIGFVMVSGMLVDDAIIVIENVYRHIEAGESIVEATIAGTEEVMWPVIAAVCTTMAAFIPMLLISGTSGEFMSILPKTVIVCLLASLFECLFILPAHYIDWGSNAKASEALASAEKSGGRISIWSHRARARVDAVIEGLRSSYLAGLEHVLANRGAFLLTCGAAFYFSCGLAQHVRVDLFPSDFRTVFITLETPVDYTLEETNEVLLGVQRALAPIRDELDEISTYAGQGMSPNEQPIFGSNYGQFFISFKEDTTGDEKRPNRLLQQIRDTMAAHAAAQPTGIVSLRVVPPRNGPPIGKPVAVRILTEDYDLAKRIAGEVKQELAGMAGVYNIEDNVPLGKRELRLGLDEFRASLHGITFDRLGLALRAANDGIVQSTFKDPQSDEDVDIRVLLPESQRTNAAEMVDVDLRAADGHLVKIADVATIDVERGYERLYHFEGQRAVVVYADVDNEQASSVSANLALQTRFADVPRRFPGVTMEFGGEFQETNEAFEDMGRAFIVALIAIYAILAAQFRSYVQPLIVMVVIVFAFIGVVFGIYGLDYALSMYVLYAMVGLAGVVVNDSLVLIDFINKERERGTPADVAARVAGRKRFRAVLLTTLTTVGGLLPMALGLSGASLVFGPFATAIVAGLAVASFLTLFVVPTLYLTVEGIKQRWQPAHPARAFDARRA